MRQAEASLHQNICDYLRLQYPGVLFHTDFGSGLRMTMGQAIKQKRLQSSRAWPDLLIAERRRCASDTYDDFPIKSGLFLEIKREGTRLKNGTMPNTPHIDEQEDILMRLRGRGFKAVFACGFDEAKKIIDEYLQ